MQVEVFDPAEVRPWRFHTRGASGMDEAALAGLASSIGREGQQQLGLARRLPPGDSHAVEAIFGVRRLEACRRAGVGWQAEVREASMSDAECAVLLYCTNAWTEGLSTVENGLQWRGMLGAGVFESESALAAALGCSLETVLRAIRTVGPDR